MVIGLGIDTVDVDRFRKILARRPKIVERLFSPDEQKSAQNFIDPAPRLAARFAAKEALMKSMGVGIGAFPFTDVSVVNAESGAPSLQLTGAAAELSQSRGVGEVLVSLTHTDLVAQAIVIAQ